MLWKNENYLYVLKDEIEFDETYVLKSRKGNHFNHIKSSKRGESSSYSCLSRDQTCILTGVESFSWNRRYAYHTSVVLIWLSL